MFFEEKKEVKRLRRLLDESNGRLEVFESILPECVVKGDLKKEDMYCEHCNDPLSCIDFKNKQCLRNCGRHDSACECRGCGVAFCPEHVKLCLEENIEFCFSCFVDHGRYCSCCAVTVN